MRLTVLTSIDDVVRRRLCCGCGACAGVRPDRYAMVDTLDHGRRPARRPAAAPGEDGAAVAVCPGRGLEHDFDPNDPRLIGELVAGWGPVMEVWEGYAADAGLRFAASSGGAASALALACLEAGGMHGVLHVRARPGAPWLNEATLSTSREAVTEAAGSRYAPASPCEGLPLIERAPGPCVFIGKPCDVAAARLAARHRPQLARRLAVTIAFFCAGTPTTRGTLEMLERMGVTDLGAVAGLRYRGRGWPGRATAAVRRGRRIEARSLSYEQAWGEVLARHKQWRCRVCADHTGEFADLAVGDPWHRLPRPGEPADPGRSLILVRTPRGRDILRLAVEAGYLHVQPAAAADLPASQPDLLRGRGAVWGRLLACRLLGAAVPRYRGFPMFRFWRSELSWRQRFRALAGAARHVLGRRRIVIQPYLPPPRAASPAPRAVAAAATTAAAAEACPAS